MKWAVGSIAFVSAACECYGTFTVWKNYKLSSWAASKVCEAFEAVQQADDVYFNDPANAVLFDAPFAEPTAVYQQRTFLRSGILSIASSLRPQLSTQLGLAAYVLGALLGFLAVLLALISN
jgi:hypothetical protein